MLEKVCSKCGAEKPLSEFYKSHGQACNPCKSCVKAAALARYHANPETLKANMRADGAKNRDRNRKRSREWHHANPERARELAKENKARIKADPVKLAAHRKASREAIAERRQDADKQAQEKAYRQSPQGQASRRKIRLGYVARKAGAFSRPGCPNVKKIFQLAQRLSVNGLSFHVDHITPLSKGGADTWENMQVLLAYANISKGAKLC